MGRSHLLRALQVARIHLASAPIAFEQIDAKQNDGKNTKTLLYAVHGREKAGSNPILSAGGRGYRQLIDAAAGVVAAVVAARGKRLVSSWLPAPRTAWLPPHPVRCLARKVRIARRHDAQMVFYGYVLCKARSEQATPKHSADRIRAAEQISPDSARPSAPSRVNERHWVLFASMSLCRTTSLLCLSTSMEAVHLR